jgi:succinate dehydrogenase / fumarate reductase cytochrome b subunit
MTMSISHRVTGTANYVGTILVAVWLLAMATGPAAYEAVQDFFGSFLGRLILFGYTWSLMHHMLGGIRHLFWDFGHGMEPGTRFALARLTLIGSVALTLAIWATAYFVR